MPPCVVLADTQAREGDHPEVALVHEPGPDGVVRGRLVIGKGILVSNESVVRYNSQLIVVTSHMLRLFLRDPVQG